MNTHVTTCGHLCPHPWPPMTIYRCRPMACFGRINARAHLVTLVIQCSLPLVWDACNIYHMYNPIDALTPGDTVARAKDDTHIFCEADDSSFKEIFRSGDFRGKPPRLPSGRLRPELVTFAPNHAQTLKRFALKKEATAAISVWRSWSPGRTFL